MSQEDETVAKKSIKTESVVAFAAIVVSVMTMLVYIYQAKIMQQQQHASVWPYVEWQMTVDPTEGFFIKVVNKGIGPAIIKSTSLKFDNESLSTLDYVRKVVGKMDSSALYFTSLDDQVLSAGEEALLFKIKTPSQGIVNLHILNDSIYNRTHYEICFCDVYGDCWTSSGRAVKESVCE